MKSGSNLERVLAAGLFAVTGELGPPMSCDAQAVRDKADILKGSVDAVNITDNQTAVVRMSSIAIPPKLFIGAAWTPMGDPVQFRVTRLAKKAAAGADFIQTQGVYDIEQFANTMKDVCNRGLHEKTAILMGIIVPKAAGMLRYMNKFVAGVSVPDEMIKRFPSIKKDMPDDEKAQARAESAEMGKKVAIELVEQAREIPGIRGVHIQGIEWEEVVPEVVGGAGLLPRPDMGADQTE